MLVNSGYSRQYIFCIKTLESDLGSWVVSFDHAFSSCLYAAVVISVSSATVYLDCGSCRDVLSLTAVYTSVVVA